MELTPERVILLGGLAMCIIYAFNNAKVPQPSEPTLQQWVNRLIEYYDPPFLNHAFRKFSYLVESGFEPEHAFEITVRS